jgi:aspartate kinase
MQDAAAIRRAATIIGERRERSPLVVVSAIGGATDELLAIAELARRGEAESALSRLEALLDRHRGILAELGGAAEPAEGVLQQVAGRLDSLLRGVSLLQELTPRALDVVAGAGERMSQALFAVAAREVGLECAMVDAREVIVTDDRFGRARPDTAALAARAAERVAPLLGPGRAVVMQGFVGATPEGVPTTLGRGGSDYSAALLGAAMEAEEIQIWTDVDGMLTADSRVVPDSLKIRELSFAEAAELAYFGARVLHPSTIEPAVSRHIPVRILNSRHPERSGTAIRHDSSRAGVPVKSIASKRGITVVQVRSLRMLMAHGFLRAIFEVFDRHQVPVDLVATSEVSVSLTLDDASRLERVVEELQRFSDVVVERDAAIVCVVGEGLRSTPGVAARIFGALGEVNVHLISQGASEINLSFVVAESDAHEAVRRLHRAFFAETPPGEIFEPLPREALA